MHEGASGSSTLDTYDPAFEWGEGHTVRSGTAEILTKDRFAAQTIVVIDSCFTQAVFGQHAEKHDERRIHHMQTIHTNLIRLQDDANTVVREAYESSKITLFELYTNPEISFKAARAMAENLINHFPPGVQTQTGINALSWCITAYTMVINPSSPVKLVQRTMGPGGLRGFGIVARRPIQKNEYIYELPGMIAKSAARPSIQSTLSLIIPHHSQKQGKEERVLFGPLRFVNHLCEGYNIAFIAIDNSCGFTAMAERDIAVHEEIFAFYGSDYFHDVEGGCPCRSCQPEMYERHEMGEEERKLDLQRQDEIDKVIIGGKRKDQKKRRRDKRKIKANDA